jgi:hypothetical protein
MKKNTKDTEKLTAAFERMVARKRMIQDHLAKGKDISELEKKGVRFVRPVSL